MSLSEPLPRSGLQSAALRGPDYPADMELIRKIAVSDPAEIDGTPQDWLMSGDAGSAGLAEMLDGLMTRLVAAGFPFDRASFHIGTLHPQVLGFTANWNPQRGTCNELRVNVHVRETSDFLLSPLRPVIDDRIAVRHNPQDPETSSHIPMMATLAGEGFTDYWAFPIPHARSFHSAMTVATRAKGGFRHDDLAALQQLIPAIALNLDLFALGRIAENVLTAYLGERSGGRVLAGEIRRGSGEVIDAVVFVADMRNYTSLSDRLPGAEMIRVLNAYFEGLVEAVRDNGGEVLKFIGDGLLAIFPISPSNPAPIAAAAALEAARAGLGAIKALNGEAGHALAVKGDWRPLDAAIALHRGPVFYGNIGSPERLDFTVTGPAVNLAARVEPLSKETGHRLLLTKAVAELLETRPESLGDFSFRGVAEPVEIFAAPE
jgi:adenylate cyclase